MPVAFPSSDGGAFSSGDGNAAFQTVAGGDPEVVSKRRALQRAINQNTSAVRNLPGTSGPDHDALWDKIEDLHKQLHNMGGLKLD
jgi:hypothetical protein